MKQNSEYTLLSKIDSPAGLKKLRPDDLVTLSGELREFIIDIVSSNPGHLGASLGVVELTIALHYVFNTPYDKLIWDVGHQAYGHKILTGRRDSFHTNRKLDGISGFPSIFESEYDSFSTGHSSTSISAALGIAMASELNKDENRQVVAIIGDGSLTGGMAYEGLNNAGAAKSNLLVILNDNNMSIDQNVGAISDYLLDITTSKTYNRFKTDVWNTLGHFNKLGPNTRKYIKYIGNSVKSLLLRQSNLFESLNFRYFGPVDGHDVVHLTRVLEDLKHIRGPKLLHCITTKGKGFLQAEINQTAFHSPGIFDRRTGEIIRTYYDFPAPPRYQDVFGETLLELAKMNEKIVGITPAMTSGCSLRIMMDSIPERTFDVGIAEQHAVTFSAGLAIQGILPYCNIYSSFMQRAYDQMVHDVALQNLNVVFCVDRGGLIGDDGATHQGVFDIAFMRSIPNMTIAAPMDEIDMRNMMYTSQLNPHGPFSIRYPRGRGTCSDWKRPFEEIPVGKGRMLKDGTDVAILSIGTTGNIVKEAIQKLEQHIPLVAHYDMRFVKPLDEELLHTVFSKFKAIITVEDGVLKGGFGSAVLEFMADNNYSSSVKRLGVPDKFITHGTQKEQYKLCGFDADSIVKEIRTLVSKKLFLKVS
jgi:1-deoxy-D-xylulose-5-phosphate synthase